MPFLAPLWSRKPMICMVNHVHTDLWPLRFRPPLSTAGRFVEQRVMPWVHRRNLVLTVSASTARELQSLGVRTANASACSHNGAAPAGPPVPRSAEPLFLALGRLAEYKRIDLLLRLWDRVRPVVGGQLVIAGDGPQRGYLESAGRSRRHLRRAGQRSRQAPPAGSGLAAAAPGADRGLGHRGHRGGPPRYPDGRLRRSGTA